MENIKINSNFDFEQLLKVVKSLTAAEKLKVNETIWENDVEIPIEHQILVSERIKSKELNPEKMIGWDDAQMILNK